jgi:hypothetical protein
MNIKQSIKLFSVAALMSVVWGCSSSKQVAKSSNSEVYDDLYASADENRPATLASRERYEQAQEEEYLNRNPEYRGQNNSQAQGTDEYYSQNWINSRGYYQNQVPFNNNNNLGWNGGWNSPFNSLGFNNWYGNPGISFGLGYGNMWGNPWNTWGGGWNSFGGGWNDPWGWGPSRWGWGSQFNTGWNSWGLGSPWGFNSFAYNSWYNPWGFNSFNDPWGYGRGWGNTYVYNYGTNVTGANGNYSNPTNTRPQRTRDTYSSSAYNGDYSGNRGGTSPRGNRNDAGYTTGNTNSSGNSDYYSRPRRDNGYSGGNSTYSSGGNSSSNTRSNSSWNWSNNNSNSSNNNSSSWGGNRSSTSSSSWGGSSGSSSGSSGGGSSSGGGGGGGSRGPR